MLAQRHPNCPITAIEIDEAAFRQAQNNVAGSTFAEQIIVKHQDILSYIPEHLFDGIICNPPYFQDNLQSPHAAKNKALHNATLNFADLANKIPHLLKSETGICWILLPEYEQSKFEKLLYKQGLFMQEKIAVYNRASSAIFRVIAHYGRQKQLVQESSITIYNGKGNEYSEAFIELLKGYYLYL
jgi:tRNA1Val (adenine37-N6)-methyltransferase